MLADDDAALGRHQARQQKLRVTRYVEELIPKAVLDSGTLIMVMQVDSPVNGSARQTIISLVFPLTNTKEEQQELIRGIRESGEGGTFRTTIYRPLIDVTREDVLDAFPTQFPGGRRTMERICYRARDVTISHIEREMGEADSERKRELAKFVIKSLEKYIERDCVAPDLGKPFPHGRAKEENDAITNAVSEYILPTKLDKKSKRVRPKTSHPPQTSPHDLPSDTEAPGPSAPNAGMLFPPGRAKGENDDITNAVSEFILSTKLDDKKSKSKGVVGCKHNPSHPPRPILEDVPSDSEGSDIFALDNASDPSAPDAGKPFPPGRSKEENDDITNVVSKYILSTKLEKKSKSKRVVSSKHNPSPPSQLILDDVPSDSEGSDPFADLDRSGETSKTANETIETSVESPNVDRTETHETVERGKGRLQRLRTHKLFSSRA